MRGLTFSARAGERIGIIGESGSGKSTLCQLLARLQLPTEGSILWNHREARSFRRREFCRRVQILFQSPQEALDPTQTVETALREPLNLHYPRLDRETGNRRIAEFLGNFRLPIDVLRRRPDQLSGGQRQRLAIIRALLVDPEVLICDEILSALDLPIQVELLRLLAAILRHSGQSIFFVSHDLFAVTKLCDRILVLRRGEIVEMADTERLLTEPQHPYTRALISNAAFQL